ncbi:hypothetical protein HII36_52635 [Nonomuraea sp. NN258]|uniref:hypothetical protein n=1 Tax=Nonomuraea antri TaxID=2730852 RepID=UPI00156A71B8|nr:hypothetical protein [Nonomuraea antri]NRQ40412.1 hypothetical protein [Nonomuraea antri]
MTEIPRWAGPIFTWRARGESGRGSGGVTSDPYLAASLLGRAVTGLGPGACGSLQRVHLDRVSRAPSYRDRRVLLEVQLDADGEIVVDGDAS